MNDDANRHDQVLGERPSNRTSSSGCECENGEETYEQYQEFCIEQRYEVSTQYEKNDQESRFRRVGENVRSGQETVRPEERKIQRDHVCWTSR